MARGPLRIEPPSPLGVYIHVPFCRVHCPYCDFYTYPARRGRDPEFVQALAAEIDLLPQRFDPEPFRVDTVYFGGGTPSTLKAAQVRQILARLGERLKVSSGAEITLEANPEDIERESLLGLLDSGPNRISLGVQTFDDGRLALLGRVHSAETALRALKLLSGLPNWSADLMFGWEGQTVPELQAELNRLLEFAPPHVSLYQLTLEPQTRFGVLAAKNLMRCADVDRQADLYLAACEALESGGLAQYEVSNFARKGWESRHNSSYWERRPYAGLGPSAASFLHQRRTRNAATLSRYVDLLRSGICPVESVEVLSPENEATERLWLGLRTREGVPAAWIAGGLESMLQQAFRQGLLTTGPSGRITLTRKGMAVADELVRRLLPTDYKRILARDI
jgi:oxygen-independent coproporphyrinogen-3 oxidase